MQERFFQIYDDLGRPVFGRIFQSPDDISPMPYDVCACLPSGWTMLEVASADEIVTEIIVTPLEG